MSFMTLTYSGTEKTLAEWGFDQDTAEMVQANAGMDVFVLSMPGAKVDSTPIIPFEGAVVIQSGRTGGGGVFAGGVIEFSGKRLMAVLDGRPEYEGILYQFGGPWYDIDQTPYQQSVYYWVGPLVTDISSYLVSDVVLFQKVTAPFTTAMRNTGQQVQDILQHVLDQYSAQGMAAPFQIGTINPTTVVPTYQVKDIKCSEAIQTCLRTSPDAVVYFEYAYSPPKVHVKQRSSMTPVSIAIADGVAHESMQLTPRYDLQARAVVLYFRQTNTLNGFVMANTTKQKYPLAGVEGGLRTIVQTIDLAGWTVNTVNASLSCSAVANNLAWWSKYIPELASGKIASFAVGTMSIMDEAGTPVGLGTYPNVLDDGTVAPWMTLPGTSTPVIAKRVTISVNAAYRQNDSHGRTMETFFSKELVARVTITNGVTGNYSTVASSTAGEPIPTGLAQAIYDSLNQLQYDGDIEMVQPEVLGMPTVGNVLNLTGGRTEWTTMNAQIQMVRRRWGSGKTSITIGPARHLSAADLTQIFLFNRFRRVWTNPATQGNAQLSTNGTVTLGTNAPKENTQTGIPERSQTVVANDLGGGNSLRLTHDAVNSVIKMRAEDSSGSAIASQSQVYISLGDLEPDLVPRTAKFRLFRFKDSADSCHAKKMYVLCTAPEADP